MKKLLIVLFTVAILLTNSFISLTALENDMPALTPGKKATLTIETINNYKPVSGFEFTIYKVADVTVEPSGTTFYTLVSEFSSSGVDFEGMSVEDSKTAAKKLKSLASTVTGIISSTDDTGTVTFTDLEPGMYLVVNTKKRLKASSYQTIAPFLVSVPGIVRSEPNNSWEYDVIAIPKSVLRFIPVPPYTPPMTGVE